MGSTHKLLEVQLDSAHDLITGRISMDLTNVFQRGHNSVKSVLQIVGNARRRIFWSISIRRAIESVRADCTLKLGGNKSSGSP
jgi:hypothetical protein